MNTKIFITNQLVTTRCCSVFLSFSFDLLFLIFIAPKSHHSSSYVILCPIFCLSFPPIPFSSTTPQQPPGFLRPKKNVAGFPAHEDGSLHIQLPPTSPSQRYSSRLKEGIFRAIWGDYFSHHLDVLLEVRTNG